MHQTGSLNLQILDHTLELNDFGNLTLTLPVHGKKLWWNNVMSLENIKCLADGEEYIYGNIVDSTVGENLQ